MLTPAFPTSFPSEAVVLLIAKVRGTVDVPNREAATAAWIIAGYGAGLALGTAPTVGNQLSAIALDDAKATAALEKLLPTNGEDQRTFTTIAVPWSLIAQWALTKFLEWLAAA